MVCSSANTWPILEKWGTILIVTSCLTLSMPYFIPGGHFSDLLRCSKVRQPRVTIVTLRSDQQGAIAIGVIFTCHRAARCGILFFVQKNVCRFQCLPLRCDPHEARIDGVANKKPLFNCVYILPIFPYFNAGPPINVRFLLLGLLE